MNKHVPKAALVAFALVEAFVPDASALTNTHAAAFHAYNAGEVTSIDYVAGAVYNIAPDPRAAIAPVGFVPPYGWGGTATFYVDGTVPSGSLSFTMYAFNPSGVYVNSVNSTVSGGNFDKRVDLPNAHHLHYISILSVLPANTATRFFGILSTL